MWLCGGETSLFLEGWERDLESGNGKHRKGSFSCRGSWKQFLSPSQFCLCIFLVFLIAGFQLLLRRLSLLFRVPDSSDSIILCFLTKVEAKICKAGWWKSVQCCGRIIRKYPWLPHSLQVCGGQRILFLQWLLFLSFSTKFQVGQMHLEGPVVPLLTSKNEPFCFCHSVIATVMAHKNHPQA